jgi:nucleoside-diphosphate-sugar epimerase
VNALVTGGTGFIGRGLVEELLRRGWNVACLVRPESETAKLDGLAVDLRLAAYDDPESVRRAVKGSEVVFHVGAVLSAPDLETFVRGNVLPTEVLAASCLASAPRLRKFVYVSSIAAGGPSRPGRLKTESDASRPTSLYGRSKLLAERSLLRFANRLPFVSIRLPNVPGPGQRETAAVAGLIAKGILPLFGSGALQTSLCFMPDAVQSLVLAALRSRGKGEFYYVTDGRLYSWRALAEALAEALHRRPLIRIGTPALLRLATLAEWQARLTPLLTRERVLSARDEYWTFDNGLIRRDLGFEPHADFASEMAAIAAACQGGSGRPEAGRITGRPKTGQAP